jgi:hypothetical protein
MTDRARRAGDSNRADLSAVLIVGVALSGLGYLLGGLGSYLVLLARDVGVGRGELTWLSAGFGAALLAVGAAGPWVLRAGAHRALRAAAATLAAGMALLAVAPGLAAAQVGGLLAGAGGSVLVLASSALLAGPGLGARLTRVNAASSAAGIAAPLLLGAIDQLAGSGRLAFLLPAPALLWVAASSPPAAPRLAGGRPSLVGVAAAWLAIVLAVSAEFAFVVWGAARLVDGGLAPASAAAAAAAFPIGMAAGRLAAPRFLARASLLVPGALVGAAGAALVIAPTGPALATGGLALAGLGIAVLYPLTLAGLVGTPGLGAGLGAALGCAASGAAALASPALLGGLAAWTGLRAAFAAVPVLLLLLIALERARR